MRARSKSQSVGRGGQQKKSLYHPPVRLPVPLPGCRTITCLNKIPCVGWMPPLSEPHLGDKEQLFPSLPFPLTAAAEKLIFLKRDGGGGEGGKKCRQDNLELRVPKQVCDRPERQSSVGIQEQILNGLASYAVIQKSDGPNPCPLIKRTTRSLLLSPLWPISLWPCAQICLHDCRFFAVNRHRGRGGRLAHSPRVSRNDDRTAAAERDNCDAIRRNTAEQKDFAAEDDRSGGGRGRKRGRPAEEE